MSPITAVQLFNANGNPELGDCSQNMPISLSKQSRLFDYRIVHHLEIMDECHSFFPITVNKDMMELTGDYLLILLSLLLSTWKLTQSNKVCCREEAGEAVKTQC